MKRVACSIGISLVFLSAALSSLYAQELWVGKDGNIRNIDSRAMVADGNLLYLATRSEVYKGAAGNEKWESIFLLSSVDNEVTCLAGKGRNILIGTRCGIFRSEDGGKTWRNVFRTLFADKSNIISLDMSKYDPRKIAAITAKGIFLSNDFGDHWRDISGNLKNKSLNCVALNKEIIYAGGADGLYARRGDPDIWERVYVRSAPEGSGHEETEEPQEEPEYRGAVNCIAVRGESVYIGVDEKILYSENGVKDWHDFGYQGLGGIIKDVLPSKKGDRLYCATTKGVFEFDKGRSRWCELYKGMDKIQAVNDIELSGAEGKFLWALTGKGMYRFESGQYMENQYTDIEKNLKTFKIIFDGEPTYAQLRQAALRFNEVSPEKIKRWRDQARLRALVPKISVGQYKHSSTNSEIYTSATRDYVVAGPDNISNGLDFSVSWDLASLIYSDDQTNIDVRSRLNTQLRNDILDDLRRAYYERKRLQFELAQSPPRDSKLWFEKEMRIQELTQTIDDLTGNYLSEHTEAKKETLLNVHE